MKVLITEIIVIIAVGGTLGVPSRDNILDKGHRVHGAGVLVLIFVEAGAELTVCVPGAVWILEGHTTPTGLDCGTPREWECNHGLARHHDEFGFPVHGVPHNLKLGNGHILGEDDHLFNQRRSGSPRVGWVGRVDNLEYPALGRGHEDDVVRLAVGSPNLAIDGQLSELTGLLKIGSDEDGHAAKEAGHGLVHDAMLLHEAERRLW